MSILDYVATITLQIRKLREELLRDEPRFALLEELERINVKFTSPTADAVGHDPATPPTGQPRFAPKGKQASPDSLRQRVIAAVAEYLKDKPYPVQVADIYDHIASLGLELGGKDPRSNLSATLWKGKRFKAIGRKGWVLKDSPLALENTEAADASNLQGGASAASIEPRLISEGTPSATVEPARGGGT